MLLVKVLWTFQICTTVNLSHVLPEASFHFTLTLKNKIILKIYFLPKQPNSSFNIISIWSKSNRSFSTELEICVGVLDTGQGSVLMSAFPANDLLQLLDWRRSIGLWGHKGYRLIQGCSTSNLQAKPPPPMWLYWNRAMCPPLPSHWPCSLSS